MDIGIFDNFDDDGQLTLFGLEEDFGELPESLGQPEPEGDEVHEEAGETFEKPESKKVSDHGEAQGAFERPELKKAALREETQGVLDDAETGKQSVRKGGSEYSGEILEGQGTGIRIRRCSCCGKLLFVREEDGGYYSSCNACGIQYVQK